MRIFHDNHREYTRSSDVVDPGLSPECTVLHNYLSDGLVPRLHKELHVEFHLTVVVLGVKIIVHPWHRKCTPFVG